MIRECRPKVHSVRSIQFRYKASEELASLFEDFRLMCNDALRIALKEEPRSRFRLIELAYPRLKEYGLHTHYVLTACEVAYSVYRNKKRKSDPYVKRAFLKLDNQSYTLNHLLLRIPIRPRQFIYFTLHGSDYHLSHVNDPNLKRGQVTITERRVGIAFSKEIAEIEPMGTVGVDINERNMTTSDSSGQTNRHDTSEVLEIKERYKEIRAKIGQRTRQDHRISQRLYAKYGKREKDRTVQRLHQVTKAVIENARKMQFGIVMEKLKGIRRLYRKGNRQGKSYRGRLNSWPFHEIQRQAEYKARWVGVHVGYVSPRGTSSKCPECGSPLMELEGRRLMCPSCKQTGDRDEIAAKNIMARVVPQARSLRGQKGSREGERSTDGANP